MKRVGVLGNGQLGAMLSEAGRALDISVEFLADSPTTTCEGFGTQRIISGDRALSIAEFAKGVDVLTYESENVPMLSLRLVPEDKLLPNRFALFNAQDRLLEKQLCQKLNLSTAPFAPVHDFVELENAIKTLSYPCILKTRTLGYDGKGQWRLNSATDLAGLRNSIDWNASTYILEGFVRFERELSVIGTRDQSGNLEVYPITENVHQDGILRKSQTRLNDPAQPASTTILRRIAEHLNYIGTLAVELFQSGDQIRVNELAPRVHNSGHWTIEGAQTSQFENHLRAICGLRLGAAKEKSDTVMFNVVGEHIDTIGINNIPGVYIHDYRKSARPGRKLGHVTIVESETANFHDAVALVEALVTEAFVGQKARCQ